MGALQRLEAAEVMPFPVWEFLLCLGKFSKFIFPRSKPELAQGGGTSSLTEVSCGVFSTLWVMVHCCSQVI